MQVVLARKGLLKLTPSEYSYGMYEPVTRAEIKGLEHERVRFAGIRNLVFHPERRTTSGMGISF
jgi:hypothetical protein